MTAFPTLYEDRFYNLLTENNVISDVLTDGDKPFEPPRREKKLAIIRRDNPLFQQPCVSGSTEGVL